MDELNSLIERIEKAEAGSRELDAEIWLLLNKPRWRKQKDWEKTNGWWRGATDPQSAVSFYTHDGMGGSSSAPRFTNSIDAAMTLADGLSEQQIWIIWSDALTACSCAEKDMRKDVARFWCASALRARQDTTTIEGDG